jgi:SAM-dependent methyltransferase
MAEFSERELTMSFGPDAIRTFEHAGWQRAASSYGNSFARATAPYIEPLLEAAEISPGQHVLDVACGPGHLAAAAFARGATAHGLDFSAEMVGIARNAHREVVVTEGDAEELPYPDCTFHAVVSSFGIHHVPRPELALAECNRVLKPGARIAFTGGLHLRKTPPGHWCSTRSLGTATVQLQRLRRRER